MKNVNAIQNRIVLLESRKRENANIVKKLKRKLRKLQVTD